MTPNDAAPVAGVIFDFDGTLTLPYLDFDGIRREIGLGPGPILETLESVSAVERERALVILHRHEHDAARNVEGRPGAREVIETIRGRGLRVGILTRNARSTLDIAMGKLGIEVDTVRTRDDATIKPSPDGILSICREWGVAPASCWMVGDYLFDILAGQNAGTTTVLIHEPRRRPPFADKADHVITRLVELIQLLPMRGA